MRCSLRVKPVMGNNRHGVNLFSLQISSCTISKCSTFALLLCLKWISKCRKLLLTTLTGTAKTAQFSVYPPQNQALAPPGGVHPAYAVTYAGAMGGRSPPNPPPPPPPPLPLNPLPNPHGLAGPSQVYQSIPPGSFFPITGPQASWSGHHHHVPMWPPAVWPHFQQ